MKPALLLFLSFQLSAQIPNWVIDSLIYEAKLSRHCDSLQVQQQTEINALQSLISAQASQLSNQKELIGVQAAKIALFPQQLQTQAGVYKLNETLLKARIKSLWGWLVGLVGFDVAVVIIILLI